MNSQQENIKQIRQQARQLVRELDVVRGVYLDSGCTLSQCHVLFELARHQQLNLNQLAENLLIDKSNTSRTVKKLVQLGFVQTKKLATDNRQKLFNLTAKGKKVLRQIDRLANQQVERALANLQAKDQLKVIEGMRLYAEALRKSRLQLNYSVRPIEKNDNPQVAKIIREVMTEFQAVGEGYSIGDPEVDNMYSAYRSKRSCFFVISRHDNILGCGGIAPLKGGADDVCELRKMFFLPELRGLGMGRYLLDTLLNEAKRRGYQQCYLETLDRMWQAKSLYEKAGFKPLKKPIGNTGHCACDCWYRLEL